MPYVIANRGDQHCVMQQGMQEPVRCFPDEAAAQAHVRELQSTVVAPSNTVQTTDAKKMPDPDMDAKKKPDGDMGMDAKKKADAGMCDIRDWFTGDVVRTVRGGREAAQYIADVMITAGLLTDADFTAAEMEAMGAKGQAFHKKDGTWAYPTPNLSYWGKAIHAFGRSLPPERGALKAYLVRRGKALNAPEEAVARISSYKD